VNNYSALNIFEKQAAVAHGKMSNEKSIM